MRIRVLVRAVLVTAAATAGAIGAAVPAGAAPGPDESADGNVIIVITPITLTNAIPLGEPPEKEPPPPGIVSIVS